MKLMSWIHPLQERTQKKEDTQLTSFMRLWDVIYPVLLYFVVGRICMVVVTVLLQGVWGVEKFMEIYEAYQGLFSAGLNGISMLVGMAVLYPAFQKEKLRISMPKGHKKDIPFLFIAGASVALFFNILFGLLQITGSSESYTEIAKRQFSLPLFMGLILYGVVSPFAEEIVFRGLVFNRLYRYFGVGAAVFGSALMFGVYHGNMVQALYGLILGVFIAIFYERYGSFLVPVLLHSAANVCVYVISTNALWQERVMNKGVCVMCAVITVILSILLFKKNKC